MKVIDGVFASRIIDRRWNEIDCRRHTSILCDRNGTPRYRLNRYAIGSLFGLYDLDAIAWSHGFYTMSSRICN